MVPVTDLLQEYKRQFLTITTDLGKRLILSVTLKKISMVKCSSVSTISKAGKRIMKQRPTPTTVNPSEFDRIELRLETHTKRAFSDSRQAVISEASYIHYYW